MIELLKYDGCQIYTDLTKSFTEYFTGYTCICCPSCKIYVQRETNVLIVLPGNLISLFSIVHTSSI